MAWRVHCLLFTLSVFFGVFLTTLGVFVFFFAVFHSFHRVVHRVLSSVAVGPPKFFFRGTLCFGRRDGTRTQAHAGARRRPPVPPNSETPDPLMLRLRYRMPGCEVFGKLAR